MGGRPKRIIAGNSAEWRECFASYQPSDGWTSSFAIANQAGKYSVDATIDGEEFVFTITPQISRNFSEGVYRAIVFLKKEADPPDPDTNVERLTGASWNLKVIADPMRSAADFRTHARTCLENIEALIEDETNKSAQSFTVDGETLSRRSPADLVMLHKRYKRLVMEEDRAAKFDGQFKGRVVRTRFK